VQPEFTEQTVIQPVAQAISQPTAQPDLRTQIYQSLHGTSLATNPQVRSYSEATVHSQRNCLYIEPAAMGQLQQEISAARVLQPGTYTITLKSGTFDYQTESGHQGEPLVLLWIYDGKVVNRATGVEVSATWSSLNGYGDSMTLEVREPARLCGFFFDTYLEDNEGAVTVGIEGAGYSEDIIVDSRRNCYLIDPATMRQLEQQIAASKLLEPGIYAIKIKNGTFSYRSELGRPGEPLVMFWIYGGAVVNHKTGVEVGATWSSLNGYNDVLMLEVRQPATLCAFFFDTYLDDNQGEITLSIARF
jgi:predicted  nucleic acid-binding Zn-ribbon protein